MSSLLDSATSKIQQLQKAFAELESHRAVTLNLKWKELEAHFHGLEKSLKRRFHELEDQEKEYETKTVEAQEILEKQKAAVAAKEQATLEKLQEKRDAAVFAIAKAREKHRKVSTKVKSAITSRKGEGGPTLVEEKHTDFTSSEESILEDVRTPTDDGTVESSKPCMFGNAEATSYPELVKLCQDMDSEGLHRFISDNRKNLASIREEIPLAFKASHDPANLVLDSLVDFYRGDLTSLDAKKDSGLLGLRRTCIMLLECLSILFMRLGSLSVSNMISEDIKVRARAIAHEWKPKLDDLDLDASNGNSLEAHAFLQLLDTFFISSDFNVEELCKLVPMVSRRRQAADLCRSLGLSDRMSGIIEVLINNGRQIDAINLAFAFGLTEQFSPVSLLKSFLKEARKAAPPKPGNVSPSSAPSSPNTQNEVCERELTALKAVLKCVEEHRLENSYPLDSLQKRMVQLEKAKADKKRATEVSKPLPKRPRASNPVNGTRPVTNVIPDRIPATHYAMPPPSTADRYPPQYMFYAGPTDTHCAPIFGAAPGYGISPGHPGYFGNGYQFHHQATYLH